jgi:hypothetical protein
MSQETKYTNAIRKLAEFFIDGRKVCEICEIYKNGEGCPFMYPGSPECLEQAVNFAIREENKTNLKPSSPL